MNLLKSALTALVCIGITLSAYAGADYIPEIEIDPMRVFNQDEVPFISFSLVCDLEPEVAPSLTVECLTDAGAPAATYERGISKNVPHYEVSLPGITEPGIYKVRILSGAKLLKSINLAYAPLQIEAAADSEPDFMQYWEEALAELAGIDPDYTLTHLPEASTADRDVYLLTMRSTPDTPGGEPVTIRAYYAEPTGEGEFPALIGFRATDGGSGVPSALRGSDRPGWCELKFFTRGQGANRVEDPDSWARYGGDFYSYGLMDDHAHYYRGAYLDCVRAVDFMASRAKVKQHSIFAAGPSQGGAFAYAAAALDPRLAGIAAAVPGHADFRNSVQTVNWPANKFNAYLSEHPEVSEDELMRFLSYYDIKNLAPLITCPVLTAVGVQDLTDSPRCALTAALLTSTPDADRRLDIYPGLGHDTPPSWSNDIMQFFGKYIDKADIDEAIMPDFQWNIGSRGFSISGAELMEVYVYTADGSAVCHVDKYAGQTLHMPAPGLYIVRVGSGVTVKLPIW